MMMMERRSTFRGKCRRLFVAQAALMVLAAAAVAARQEATDGTRASGLRPGPQAVGFEVRAREDRTRRINQTDAATWIGLAVWYPAHRPTGTPRAMTAMDYRLTRFRDRPTPAQRRVLEDDEVEALVAWQHVGIVPLTDQQARASLATRGLAVRGAPPIPGRSSCCSEDRTT
jgi:hypothetical protein